MYSDLEPADLEMEDATIDELKDGPCPHCDEIMLEEIKKHALECISEETGDADVLFVSGLKCANCNELFFDQESAEAYMNMMLHLDRQEEPGFKLLMTEDGPEKVTIH